MLTWAVALAVWRFGRIEQRWDAASAAAGADEPPPNRAEDQAALDSAR